MARFFRLAGLGTNSKSTTATRSEKSTQNSTRGGASKSVYSKEIPTSQSRLSEDSTDVFDNVDAASSLQTKSGLALNKDPSKSYMVRLSNSRTQESITRDEERIDNDRMSNRGRKLERRDDGTLRDDEVRSRSTSRQNGTTKTFRSGTRSPTPKASHRRGRSSSKNQKHTRGSKSRKPTKSTNEDGKTRHDNSNNRRRTMSRPRGKFVSNKKKWNIALGSGRFLQQRSRSLSAESRTKKKGAMKRLSWTGTTSKDELSARLVARDSTMDNGHDTTQERYQPGKRYHVDDDGHSIIDRVQALDDSYWDFVLERKKNCSDAEALEDICSFDDSILDAYNDGWLATYDRCLGAVCGFDVDDVPPSSDKGEQSSKPNWIKNHACTEIDPSCALVDMKDDVVMEILGHANQVKDPLTLDMDQKE